MTELARSAGRFDGRTAVITGGGSGIGLATARRLAAEGARVVVADVDADAGAAAADEVDGLFVRTDVTCESDVEALFAAAVATYGCVDVAFNNAGISPPEDDSILTTGLGRLAPGAGGQPHLGVPVLPRRDPAHAAPGPRRDRQHGVVRRGDGRRDLADLLHGVQGRGARDVAGARRAVRAGGHPGQRAVPRAGGHPAAAGAVRRRPGACPRRLVHIPMGRFARPEEIAGTVAFLASDDASFITASTFLVDGGISAAYVTPL